MNIFRLLGDVLHLFAMIILLFNILKTKSCTGISGKSQILFTMVFTTRYLDVVTTYVSLYNSIMKVVFMGISLTIVYLIYIEFRSTYNRDQDIFRVEFLILPAFILALLINIDFTLIEILWAASIYLESVAILPQLVMIARKGKMESTVAYYLLALGSYRGFYILNWIYRYDTENHYDIISIVSGTIQTILFCSFFYLYLAKESISLVKFAENMVNTCSGILCEKCPVSNVTEETIEDAKTDLFVVDQENIVIDKNFSGVLKPKSFPQVHKNPLDLLEYLEGNKAKPSIQ